MNHLWSSHCGSVEINLTSIHEDVDSIPGLAQRVKDTALLWALVVGCRHSSDPMLLWLWCRLADAIQPLAWEPPYAEGVALKRPKKKKKSESIIILSFSLGKKLPFSQRMRKKPIFSPNLFILARFYITMIYRLRLFP